MTKSHKDTKIEKIDLICNMHTSGGEVWVRPENIVDPTGGFIKDLENKLNEIIDYLNENKPY